MMFYTRSTQNTSLRQILRNTAVLAVAVLCLAACGQTKGERALSGAGIGAGAGAAGAAVTGGDIGTGALIGGAAGAAAGALTDEETVDLGDFPD